MLRKIAKQRVIANNRQKVIIQRKIIQTPPNDSKLRVVLDTTIFISALIAKKKGHMDSAPLQIIEAFEADIFYLLMNPTLLLEYERLLHFQVKKGLINVKDVGEMISLVRSKGWFARMFVDKPIKTYSCKDDLLFDSTGMLKADYLVTMDRHLLKKKRQLNTGKIKIISAGDFLHKVLGETVHF